MADLRSKALAYLRGGLVTVKERPAGSQRVIAEVRSSRPEREQPYIVDRWDNGDWTCTCRSGLVDGSCPHVAAVALVTVPDESLARAS